MTATKESSLGETRRPHVADVGHALLCPTYGRGRGRLGKAERAQQGDRQSQPKHHLKFK